MINDQSIFRLINFDTLLSRVLGHYLDNHKANGDSETILFDVLNLLCVNYSYLYNTDFTFSDTCNHIDIHIQQNNQGNMCREQFSFLIPPVVTRA